MGGCRWRIWCGHGGNERNRDKGIQNKRGRDACSLSMNPVLYVYPVTDFGPYEDSDPPTAGNS
jgi:hypothetical protein